MIEQRHHLRDVKRSAAPASDRVGGQVIGDAPGLELCPDAPERLDHLGPQVARQQRQDVLAPDLGAERERFSREQLVKGFEVHFGALEFRPGILPMIVGIGAPDDIGG